jgi:hypothetical protein
LHRSVETLRQQTGQGVLGHRAADFSISGRSLHLLEHLAAEGLAYDSSIFPVRHPRYGVPGAWRVPYRVRCASGRMLIEFPLSTVHLAGMLLPAAGGGYLRLFPYGWTRLALRALQRQGTPAACYLHPYEIDTSEMREIPYPVPTLLLKEHIVVQQPVALAQHWLQRQAEGRNEFKQIHGFLAARNIRLSPYT